MKLISWKHPVVPRLRRQGRPGAHRQGREEMADFDVLCLQEIASNYPDLAGSSGEDQYAALARLFPRYTVVKGVATEYGPPQGDRREFGNAIVTRLPVLQAFRRLRPGRRIPSVPSMQRSAVEVVLDTRSGRCA